MTSVLALEALGVTYRGRRGAVAAVTGVSFDIGAGELVGLVGESGSGKTAIALAVLGLLPAAARPEVTGRIVLDGVELTALDPRARQQSRRRALAYVPQEPLSALNPTLRVAFQLDLLQRYREPALSRAERRRRARAALERMELSDPERILASYPFQLSGGQVQRVLLAAAFLATPRLIVADEPTTALDPTVQAEVLELLGSRARATGTSVLFISHNLGVVQRMCDRVVVLRRGRVVEQGACAQILTAPSADYTRALLASLPGRSPPRTPLPVGSLA